jgi:type I restriction enzyme R subunit
LRRVNSRILYEQMIGRATRQCPDIGKEVFRIFDAVDLYPHIQNLTEMKPVVVEPSISIGQLIKEMVEATEEHQRETIRDQLIVRLRRRIKGLSEEVRQSFESMAGETPEAMLKRLREEPTVETATWLSTRPALAPLLDWKSEDGTPPYLPISTHGDKVISVTHGYGGGQKPEDYLSSFTAFVRDNQNTIAALKLVVQRPRDLKRADLKELRMALDQRGFTDQALRRVWADAKNEEIAASIIGFVRQAAAWRRSASTPRSADPGRGPWLSARRYRRARVAASWARP